jgi:bifunctional non-homologous end joining protein LigD
MPVKQRVEVEGRSLALTNLDKVLYPGSAFTKAHVIDFYMRIAKWLIPHFAGHPVTLQRFPDGVRGKMFYEKNAPKYTPEWVHTTEAPRQAGGDPIHYICIDDLPTLVWCANVASLELHPFLHRAGELNHPTSIVFDLDPGEGADLVSCAEVAVLLRSLLEKNGLQCFPKVSGSKGLQVYAPLNTAVTYSETRFAAQAVAQILQRQRPELIIAEMAKERRRQKVFIDWSQNSDFKTTVGVYSLRAKNDIPYVSAPVTWAELEELGTKRKAELMRFEPDALLKRVEKIGDLFAPLLKLKQKLSPISEKASVSSPPTSKIKDMAPKKVSAARSKAGVAPLKFVEPMLLLKDEHAARGKRLALRDQTRWISGARAENRRAGRASFEK